MSKDLNADVRPNFAHISDPHDETLYAQSALTPAANFNPCAKIAEQILADVSNPLICLHTIAVKAQTTVEAIHLWLARPDIAQRFEAIESTLRRRARINVLHNVNAVTETCATIMERFYRAPDRGPIDDRDPRTHLIRARNASNALMASRVMIHMSRYLDGPPPSHRHTHTPRPTPTPTPTARPELHTPIADSTAHTNTTNNEDTNSNITPPSPSTFRALPSLPDIGFLKEDHIPRATLTKEPAPTPQEDHPARPVSPVPPIAARSDRCAFTDAPENQSPSPHHTTSVPSVPSVLPVPSNLSPSTPSKPPHTHKKQKHKSKNQSPKRSSPRRSRDPTAP